MSGSAPARCPADFSLLDVRVQDEPWEYYRVIHREAPVYFMPETGLYMISGYAELRAVLQDCETFSNCISSGFLQGENWKDYENILKARGWVDISTLNSADPPAHTRYRQIGDRVFNARQIEALASKVEEIVNTLIDTFIDRGECEFTSEFAFPLVGTVICGQLGLDPQDMRAFKRWGDAIMLPASRVLTREELAENAETILEMQHFIAGKLEERRRKPQADLISALVHARTDDGEALTMHELQSLMRQFLSGTFESVVTGLSHAMWLLLRFPDQMAKLRANRALMKPFVEEVLRFDTPVPGLGRLVTRDTELGGVLLPKGAILMVRYAAANRDPHRFEHPDKFDIERKDQGHLSFGAGVHLCIGRVLARREMVTAFGAILDRMDDIALARPLPDPVHAPHLMLRPMKELPIKFRKIH